MSMRMVTALIEWYLMDRCESCNGTDGLTLVIESGEPFYVCQRCAVVD